ncbi:Protein TAR1 [Capsicum baccatum]|uniref:Protein TAR1 n=1 Tax=Capsicum baccatum TaxID=33114 RepID=A0A2G2V6T2_CAPBA|nr:Protein TAR1 [Capsicum baccatum]
MAPRCLGAMVPRYHSAKLPWCHGSLVTTLRWCRGALVPWRYGAKLPWCHGARISNLTKTPPWQATIRPPAFVIGGVSSIALDESRKTSSYDAVVFRKRPLDIVCLTVLNGTHATLEKQEANSGKGKTNLSHDGLNPAHVPYWWVNNPTLGEFCFTMIGRADIEGSKSNVAMNAWLPQANYPCGNFSDTSSFEFRSRIPLVRTSSELVVRRAGKVPKGTVPNERFARMYRCGPPPEFLLASPRSGIVHHLSGPDRYAHTQTLLRRSRSIGGAPLGGILPKSFLAPYGFTQPLTHTHVRLLGPCFKTGRMGSPQASVWSAQMPKHARGTRCLPESRRRHSTSVSRARALAASQIHAGPCPESIGGPASRRSTSDWGALPAPICFPPNNVNHSLTFFSKSFSSLPRGTCSLSVSRPYLALDGIHCPIWAAIPNNPTHRQRLVVRQGLGTTGISPSPTPPFKGLGPGPPLRTLLQTTIRTTESPNSKAGLFPVRSPLLWESL